MRLLFDLQALQNESRNRGIGRYVQSLFNALAKRKDIELYALLNASMNDTLQPVLANVEERLGEGRAFIFPGLENTRLEVEDNIFRWRLSQAAYEAFVEQAGCDAILLGSVVEGFIDGTSLSYRAPDTSYLKAVVVHDLIPLMDEEKYLSWDKARAWYYDRISHVEAADLALTNSENTRREVLDFLDFKPKDVVTISTAIDASIFNTNGTGDPALLERLRIVRPYLMHTSVIEPRKNFDGLVKAFAALPEAVRDAYQLVFVGKADDETKEGLYSLAIGEGLTREHLIFAGFVSDEELAALYRDCTLFVFPSFHEGFGLPALEAMSCGCATIGSSVTSIPEVIKSAALTFDPTNTQQMSELINRLLSKKGELAKAKAHAVKHAETFSWDRVAERTIAAIRDAVQKGPATPPAPFPSADRMVDHVATRVDLSECPQGDLEALTQCLAKAENALTQVHSSSLRRIRRPWRIEGPFDSSYSLAIVNRETARAMASLGWSVALHSTEGPGDFEADTEFLTANPDLEKMHQKAASSTHAQSFAVSRLLYPPRVSDMTSSINTLHHYAWEESGFPREWVDDFNKNLTMLTVLSDHVKKVMIDNGVSVPIAITGNGVDHWDRIRSDKAYSVEGRSFRFLHVSACFPRKGVDALLVAYEAAFTIDDDVSLIIKTFENPHNTVHEMLSEMQARNPRFPHVVTIVEDLPEDQLKAIYEQCDVLVGASFAEGFGLPFAEAMLSGIPVITTNWGGQLDFCNPGNSWLVDYSFERAETHFGLWSSVWARADVRSLSQAMKDSIEVGRENRSEMAARGRRQLMARHTWSDVARRLTASAATLPNHTPRDPKIGWISTWHSKCGIATYSQHLTEAIPSEVTVFSPANEKSLVGQDGSIRSWIQSKKASDLWRVLSHPEARGLDTYVIQFNYGFFNHADLSRFIREAKALGKTVLICLHSTIDPPGEADETNFNLAWLAPSLAACDRVLVHSIADLNRLKQLGLVENVALFPHGVLRRPEPAPARELPDLPIVSTYGFALPHKGLPEALHAVKALHEQGQNVRLRMVNAEYPVPDSANLIDELKRLRDDLGLSDHVEMHNRFLPDHESLALLTDSDLIVFPYQRTAESASGAVRYGMAVERPVAVTALPIFDDLGEAAYVMKGTSANDIADGINYILSEISKKSTFASDVNQKAKSWCEQHDYRETGKRLFHMCKALRQ